LQFYKYSADFLNFVALVDEVLVAEQIIETQLAGFPLGLRAGVKGAVLGAHLLGGITSHPKRLFVSHTYQPGVSALPEYAYYRPMHLDEQFEFRVKAAPKHLIWRRNRGDTFVRSGCKCKDLQSFSAAT
jgi:hypothetical protein